MLISVSKEVSNWVTDREVSDMTLFSAVRVRRYLVRRFSQFCDTQTRQRVTVEIIMRFVKYVKYT